MPDCGASVPLATVSGVEARSQGTAAVDDTTDRTIDTTAAARLLGYAPATLTRKCRQGKMAGIAWQNEPGGPWCFSRAGVLALIEARKQRIRPSALARDRP